MTAPIASGWSGGRVGFAPTGKRRLVTAHTLNGSRAAKFVLHDSPARGQYVLRHPQKPEVPT